MNIDCILAEQLYAFRYKEEKDHELDRLIELWKDVSYLYEFARSNNVANKNAFVDKILRDAEELEDYLDELVVQKCNYSHFFEPLLYTDFRKNIARTKCKIQSSRIRHYANIYVKN